jgi:hypothetical protein
MRKVIIGCVLFTGAALMSYAEFPADGVRLLRRESSDKVSSLKKALTQTTTEWERLSLVDLMFEFICLADMSNSPNAAEVFSMPYAKYFNVDRSARYVATESSIGTIDPYGLVFMIRPSMEMERLLGREFEKKIGLAHIARRQETNMIITGVRCMPSPGCTWRPKIIHE